ncbi:nicotinamide-nucleotide amidohydrolase family protein [Candidatus Neptunochlamydia vexilliferae]|nr:nicotinamide-nucleotide amidohydrolase family protein [Candidatus Neptunochlamydia vexilliferae]
MTIEILSIGNEILSGHTINTNAGVVAQALLPEGISVGRVTVLPDDKALLKQGIEEAMERSSFLITTGGLGPTGDDLTLPILESLYGLAKQKIVNPLGTAPGEFFEGKIPLVALPGVPSQMEVMLPEVLKIIQKYITEKHYVSSLYLCLMREMEVEPYLRILEKEHPGVTIGICPGRGVLSLYLHADDPNLFPPVEEKLVKRLYIHLFSRKDKQIAVGLQEWMVANGKTLATGESCTGGHLAANLTIHPGASDYFLGSIVSYSNTLKESALEVQAKTLKEHGAASKEVVIEMAAGVKKLTGADYVMTVSGIAGPTGGTADKPVGTVWAAIATPEKTYTGLIPARKNRKTIIDYSVTYLLANLWRHVAHNIEPFK